MKDAEPKTMKKWRWLGANSIVLESDEKVYVGDRVRLERTTALVTKIQARRDVDGVILYLR